MADVDANAFRVNTPTHLSPSTTPTIFPSLKAYTTVNGCTITGKLQQWLRNNYTTSDLYDHIWRKTSLTIDKMNKIAWDNLGSALECQHLHNKVRLVKFIHNWLNTGYQKKKFDENAVDGCPVCQTTEEIWMYLFQCQHEDAIAIQTLAITMFKSELLKLGTAPIIKQVLCYKIAQWCAMPALPIPIIADDSMGEVVRSTVEDQHLIGWNNFMKGYINIKWKVAQKTHNDALPTSKKCRDFDKELWSSKVISAIWSIF
eukprot:10673679-Ditylum_brightwellii.AAC.1